MQVSNSTSSLRVPALIPRDLTSQYDRRQGQTTPDKTPVEQVIQGEVIPRQFSPSIIRAQHQQYIDGQARALPRDIPARTAVQRYLETELEGVNQRAGLDIYV